MRLLVLMLLGCANEPPPKQKGPPPEVHQVCINELMPRTELGPEGSDWLELSGPPDFALDGWSLLWDRDDPNRFSLDGLALDGEGFLVLYADELEEPLHLPFKLSSDGESVGIEAPDLTREWVTWGPVAADVALARAWDCCAEEACWEEVLEGTPGASNGLPPEE